MKIKIYVLKDPYTKEIRYIGRTKNSLKVRLSGHCCKAKQNQVKTYKDNWILKLSEKPIIQQIEEVEGWEESYLREQEIIKEYINKGCRLVNLHDRGTGGLLRDISEEQKKKISDKIKQLHKDGVLSCGRKAVDIYNLNGEFISTFKSYKEAAEYIGISQKQFQTSMRRKARKIHNYRVVNQGVSIIGKLEHRKRSIPKNYVTLYLEDITTGEIITFESVKAFKEYFNVGASTSNYYVNKNRLYKGKYKITNARLKSDKLLETP